MIDLIKNLLNFEKNEHYIRGLSDEEERLDCMPSSKGRTAAEAKLYGMSNVTAHALDKYYRPAIEEIEKLFNMTFSWNL